MKNLKITVIALLTLTLATVSCKKTEAPAAAPVQQNDGNDQNGGANDTTNNPTDSIISFMDKIGSIAADSTITYDSTLAMSNDISFVNIPYDYSGIDIFTANNGGMTNNELSTAGSYADRLSGVRIYNEATSAWEVYTLVGSSAHSLSIFTTNGFEVLLGGTFTNANGDTVVIPEVVLK